MSSEVKVAPWLCYEEIEKSVRVDADDRATEDYSTQCTCRVTTDSEGNSIRCSDESCVNWITQTECVKCDQDTCQNQRIQRGMIKKLEVLEVEGKGFGLFCNEDVIRKGEYIREYVGELVSKVELEKRLTATKNATHLFVMELKDDCFVDSRKKASISRFINHSCEPNCTIEIWTVKRRLKAAIFSLKDIPRGTELTFDYQWAPCEGRPPTRCMCGTPSCRGYLEVFDDDEHMRELTTVRTGLWVSSKEAQELAARAEGTNGAEWLIHKRIKVWWDGNDSYFEADVISYDAVTGLHKVHYLVDDDVSTERLWSTGIDDKDTVISDGKAGINSRHSKGGATVWEMLDETRKERFIGLKKRKITTDEGTGETQKAPVEPALNPPPLKKVFPSPSIPKHQPSPCVTAIKPVDKKVALDDSFCTFVVKKFVVAKPNFTFHNNNVFGQFSEIIKIQFQVNVKKSIVSVGVNSPTVTSSPLSGNIQEPGSLYGNIKDTFGVVVYGDAAAVDEAVEFVTISKMLQLQYLKTQLQRFVDKQSTIFTVDWRASLNSNSFKPLIAAKNIKFGVIGLLDVNQLPLSRISHLVTLPETAPSSPRSPRSPRSQPGRARSGGTGSNLPVATYLEIQDRFRVVLEHFKFGVFTTIHAMVLLQRILSSPYSFSASPTDVVAVISTTILISLKATDTFTTKLLVAVITASYNSVFRSTMLNDPLDPKGSDASQLRMYLEKCTQCEALILGSLNYDVFICNALGMLGSEKHMSSNDNETPIEGLLLFSFLYKKYFYNGTTDSPISAAASVFITIPTEICTLCCMFIGELFFKASSESVELGRIRQPGSGIVVCTDALVTYRHMQARGAITESVLLASLRAVCQVCEHLDFDDVKQFLRDICELKHLGVCQLNALTWKDVLNICVEVVRHLVESSSNKDTGSAHSQSTPLSSIQSRSDSSRPPIAPRCTQPLLQSEVQLNGSSSYRTPSPAHSHSSRSRFSPVRNTIGISSSESASMYMSGPPSTPTNRPQVQEMALSSPSLTLSTRLLRARSPWLNDKLDDVVSIEKRTNDEKTEKARTEAKLNEIEKQREKISGSKVVDYSNGGDTGNNRQGTSTLSQESPLTTVKNNHLQISKLRFPSASPAANSENYASFAFATLPSNVVTHPHYDSAATYALLPWPSLKTVHREVHKVHQSLSCTYFSTGISDNILSEASWGGMPSTALHELTLMQHVHYFATPHSNVTFQDEYVSNSISSEYKVTDVILEPVAMSTVKLELFSSERSPIGAASSSLRSSSSPSSSHKAVSVVGSGPSSTSHELSSGTFGDALSLVTSPNPQTSPASKSHSKDSVNAPASNEMKISPSYMCLVAVVPLSQLALPMKSIMLAHDQVSLSGAFYRSMALDIFSAAEHCASCGIVFRYLTLDHFNLSSSGRVLLSSFAGGVLLPQGYGHVSQKQQMKASGSKVSSSICSSMAPEVLFGSMPDIASTVWCAAYVCCHLLCGEPLIKPAQSEIKQVQYVFATLGTPISMGYDPVAFDKLPFAKKYGGQLISKDKQKIDTSSRVCKVLTLKCRACVTETFTSTTTDTPVQEDDKYSTKNVAIQLLVSCTHIVPEKRLSFEQIFQSPFFTLPISHGRDQQMKLLQNVLCPPGEDWSGRKVDVVHVDSKGSSTSKEDACNGFHGRDTENRDIRGFDRRSETKYGDSRQKSRSPRNGEGNVRGRDERVDRESDRNRSTDRDQSNRYDRNNNGYSERSVDRNNSQDRYKSDDRHQRRHRDHSYDKNGSWPSPHDGYRTSSPSYNRDCNNFSPRDRNDHNTTDRHRGDGKRSREWDRNEWSDRGQGQRPGRY